MATVGAHQVELYDPEHPDEPVIALAANFDPHTMTRWEHRDVTAPLPERGLVEPAVAAAAPGGEEEESAGEEDTGEEAAFRFEQESDAPGTAAPGPDTRFVTTGAVSDDAKE
jgi:hypothetical protein